jgi:hypothetical protein
MASLPGPTGVGDRRGGQAQRDRQQGRGELAPTVGPTCSYHRMVTLGWSDRQQRGPPIHPILVGLTKQHDQRKGRIAQRLAVHL